jgi:hypothetical protein
MDNIGKPDNYYMNQYSQDPNASVTGGYIEERLSKLEYHQRFILSDGICKSCNLPTDANFPICNDCLATIGDITQAKRDLKFVF